MIKLNDFRQIVRTDKFLHVIPNFGTWNGHGYVELFYDKICAPMKEDATAILELGVEGGNSILLWKLYFERAKVYGVDVRPQPYPNSCNIILYGHTDGYDDNFVHHIGQQEPGGFDLIIDDATHVPIDQLAFIDKYWQFVKPGGWLVIEDVVEHKQPGITQQLVDKGAMLPDVHVSEWYKSYYALEFGQLVDYRAVTIQKRK